MKSRMPCLIIFGALLGATAISSLPADSDAATPSVAAARQAQAVQDLKFLRDLTRDVVEASRVKSGQKTAGSPTNTCGFTLIMPGGRGSYPAFWIRDFAMSLESGFITAEEMLNHLRLTARCQNGPGAHAPPRPGRSALCHPGPYQLRWRCGLYPGTYSSGDDHGKGACGILPPVDDHYEFIHIAHCLFRTAGKGEFLQEQIKGMPLLDRLAAAFEAPQTDAQTGSVVTDDAQRAVGFGFCDAVYFTGKMLFPSLLRFRAAGQLAELCQATRRAEPERGYRQIQQRISENLASTFGEPARLGGWLMAATKVGRQPDVWGTLYALHLGAIKGAAAERAARTLVDAVRRKTIVFEGAVRHVPTDLDASPASAWEKTAGVAINTYQNGAYWHTPTGWLIAAVRQSDPQLASELLSQYLQHLQQNDFRQGPGHEAPWECFGPKGYAQNGIYMTSVTLPWAVLSSFPGPSP